MVYVPFTLSVRDVIARAAGLMGEPAILQGADPDRLAQYYAALNEFIQSYCRTRACWWLEKSSKMATHADQQDYALRSQAHATVEVMDWLAQAVIVDGKTYAMDSAQTTQKDWAEAMVAIINADADRQVQATVGISPTNPDLYGAIELWWTGDDGVGQTLTGGTGDETNGYLTIYPFALSMQDFRALTWLQLDGVGPLERAYAHDAKDYANATTGQPMSYCMVGGKTTLRLFSSTCGAPDGVYLLNVGYQARPSALLPDGQGDLDWPEEFHDILPHAVKLLLHAGAWDEAASFGDQWFSRRLAELERYRVDRTPGPERYGSAEPSDIPSEFRVSLDNELP